MKRITLAMMFSVAVPILAAAQIPPAPPTPPEKAARPTPPEKAARPTPPKRTTGPDKFFGPEVAIEPITVGPLKLELDAMQHEMEFQAHEMKLHALDLAHADVDLMVSKDLLRFELEDFSKFKADELAASAKMLAADVKAMVPLSIDWPGKGPTIEKSDRFGRDKLLSGKPRQAWASNDPADSLYRAAREALNRGEYRRAAQLFGDVQKKFPKSEYVLDCTYWEAFSRYRAGGTDDLRQALRILEEGRVQLASLRNEGSVDVQALRARVQGALAARGDAKAAEELRREAQSGPPSCDREEIAVRAEALGALGQMDRAAAMPAVKKVLARRDECTVELRRRALFIATRDADAEAIALTLDVARNDPDQGIRGEAMRWLPRIAGDNAVPQLEELLRTSPDEQSQRSAINALASIDSDLARKAIRAIIERNDASERVRYEAIVSLSRERDGRSPGADDLAYLRSLYTKLQAWPRLREAVLTALSRIDTPENAQFLLAIARNENEATAVRAMAVQRLGRMASVSLNDIAKLYDIADSRSMREQILYALYQRKDAEAVDRMIEIARKDTDPQIRRRAIELLARRDDPRARKWLQEIIDK